jgi:hypothetical protein
MTARYFSHSPRGFANEITVFAVEAERADDWASWFNASNPPSAPELQPITRRQAERLLRRDGVLLQTHEQDAEYLLSERLQHTLNHESVTSACRAALDYRAACEKEDAFAADMEAAHPELAVAPR